MKYAIIESGGKQYKAVEGETIEVDRLPVNAGDKVGLERVLMLVDGEETTIGTPTVGDIQVNTTVMDHFKGPKLIVFKYSPKKRIRVKSGHRQQYTRLMVDVIGKPGASRKVTKTEKEEAPAIEKVEAKVGKVEKKEATATSSSKGKTPAAKKKKTEKAPAASSPKGKKTEKAPAKKTTAKKPDTTSSPKGKKTSSTKTTKK